MAPIHTQPTVLFARDIVRLSDAELDQYLEAHGRSGFPTGLIFRVAKDHRLVDVEDPKNLPEDFIQRLRVRAGPSDTAKSRPIDLDGLTTRLEQIPPRSPSLASTEPINEEEDYRDLLASETECYDTLIRQGGRPSHPVSLGRDVLEDQGEYSEILSYWQLHNGDGENRKWAVFSSQKCEWQRFLKYQRRNRKEGRFPEYANELERTLARHEFTRPYQLTEDAERQDKLTTWIEFLGYEYWIYDGYMAKLRLRQPMYDEAWKELVDSQVLRPHETEEFICGDESKYQRAGEKDQAKRAVESAKAAVISAEQAIDDPGRSGITQRDLQKDLVAARSRLASAIKSLELITRRNDLVYEFFKKTGEWKIVNDKIVMSYLSMKEKAEHRTMLLRWILQQIPLIERELSPAKVAENNASKGDSGKRLSKRNRGHDSHEERISKRQRQGDESNTISHRRTRGSAAKERVSLPKGSCHELLIEEQPSKQPYPYSQKPRRSSHNTSDAAILGEPLSFQPVTIADSTANAPRSVKSRPIRRVIIKKTRSEAQIPAQRVLDGKARVMKKGRGGGKLSEILAYGTSLRRSTRNRNPPDRF